MISHEEARMLASARADGELGAGRVTELEEHLAGCAACAQFAAGIARLSVLASLLPAEGPVPGFVERIERMLGPVRPIVRPRARWRVRVGAVAAAAAVAFAVVVGGLPIRTFRVVPAEAAEALLRIRTLDVVRDIEQTSFEGRTTRTRERIRYAAPASVRIDRFDAAGALLETEIRTPGIRFRTQGGDGILERNRPPEPNPVPEPLSPALALIGGGETPGPVVAGRQTVRFTLQNDFLKREALIDAEHATVLDNDVAIVLEKEILGEGQRRTRKRTVSIVYNEPLEEGVFAVPDIKPVDGGFRPRPVTALPLSPAAAPSGFTLVMAGTGPSGDAILYARGAFPILVLIDAEPGGTRIEEVPVTVGGRAGVVLLGIYELPVIRFMVDGRTVAISAPATVDGLRMLAEEMFPATE